jgi:hypothetical protein
MPPKHNPLGLNPLQLKTLTLMQEMARLERHGQPLDDEPGAFLVGNLPHPHGNHFHLGHAVVATRDATGLDNAGAWLALERKGLIRSGFPERAVVTPAGMAYDTGLRDAIMHRSDH